MKQSPNSRVKGLVIASLRNDGINGLIRVSLSVSLL